ncbi:hypothetical protein B0O80DRAFT_497718 [Mortierella sp. GBAus27b]|nr:hypothetical protein B0O80DRAFT_497718 [Mortierella sp. GBAus27b]
MTDQSTAIEYQMNTIMIPTLWSVIVDVVVNISAPFTILQRTVPGIMFSRYHGFFEVHFVEQGFATLIAQNFLLQRSILTMADMQSYIDDLQRKLVTYELAVEAYDEFVSKQSLESGGDIRSILLDPNHRDFQRVVEDFVQDPASVTPDTTISTDPDTLRALVQACRTATLARIRAFKRDLEDVGATTLI